MNTKELAQKVADIQGVSEKDARAIIAAAFDTIAEAMSRSEEVNLPGFGKFRRKETPARPGRNPATGESIEIAAASKVTFQAAKALKDRL